LSEQNRSLTVRADLVNGDRKLLPGSFVRVTPLISPDTAALMVPTQAIIPQSRGKKAAILRDGSVEMTLVETGIRDSAMVQVTSGIRAGDTVIITGLMGLKQGMKASVRKIITY
jgi:membrane fusion protein, multidrug efflux system